MFRVLIVALSLSAGALSQSQTIDSQQLKCLVCRSTVEELDAELSKIDPSKTIEVGNYRLDASGNVKQKVVPLRQSEVHISEVMDSICDRLDDYVRGTYKTTGQLTILKIMGPDGSMNPDFSKVDIIQDGDLNKSLKFYCQSIVDEFEDDIVKFFSKGAKDIDVQLCTDIAHYCTDSVSEDDDGLDKDEL